jgi:hypothetical protein
MGRAARVAIKQGADPAEALKDVLDAHNAYLTCPGAPERRWVREHRHALYTLLGDA